MSKERTAEAFIGPVVETIVDLLMDMERRLRLDGVPNSNFPEIAAASTRQQYRQAVKARMRDKFNG